MASLTTGGTSALTGRLATTVRNSDQDRAKARREVRRWKVRQFLFYGFRELPLGIYLFLFPLLKFLIPGLNVQVGRLYAKVVRNLPQMPEGWVYLGLRRARSGADCLVYETPEGYTFELSLNDAKCREAGTRVVDYGFVGRHLVVTAGKNYLAACMDNTSEPENLKFHGYGTGSTAAAAGDTALQTELTTQYATDNTRPTGSQAHSTNTYTTIATVTPDASVSVTEWGLLTQAATGGGTLLDRQVFTAIALNGTGDSLQTSYVLTFS